MAVKLIGAVFVVLGGGGFGLILSNAVKRETTCLREFISALEFMECELVYRMTSLPHLCQTIAPMLAGPIRDFFICLAEELEQQTASRVQLCVTHALERCKDIPLGVRQRIEILGNSLGSFDLDGQIKCIRAMNDENMRIYEKMSLNQSGQLRCYKTLAICAGAALAILFI